MKLEPLRIAQITDIHLTEFDGDTLQGVDTGESLRHVIKAIIALSPRPSLIIARTDADAANLITSDIDERDQRFITVERTNEGFFHVKNGIEQGIARGLSYAPYADLIWMETSNPDLDYAREFALQKEGFKAVKHQSFVGTTYFDAVQNTITLGNSSTMAMNNSTEIEQFK